MSAFFNTRIDFLKLENRVIYKAVLSEGQR